MIRQDEVGAGASNGSQDLEGDAPLVHHAGGGGGLHHGVLAAHVVSAEGERGGLAHPTEHVEVGERGLYHQHVGAFFLVQTGLAKTLPRIGRIHLVGRPVAELGGAVGCLPEGSVERGGVFHRVREDG